MIEFIRRRGTLQRAGAENTLGAVSHSSPPMADQVSHLAVLQNHPAGPKVFADIT
jgi:hypothetical protein